LKTCNIYEILVRLDIDSYYVYVLQLCYLWS